MQEKKRVGIWVRVSTEDQAKGESPEHHEKRARLYAEAKDWEVHTVYHLEAMSGKSVMGYGETKRMLQDIQKGEISGLIFSKLARLARNTKELLEFADIFKAENADLISLYEAIDTSTPAGRLFYTMIAAMAQWEREEITDRVSASVPIRAKLGKHMGGIAPFGYKWSGHDLVIDEKTAPVRKLVHELYLKHKRKKAVARILNEQGYRTATGKQFTDTSIRVLIQDPIAKGIRRVNYTKGKGKDKVFKPVEDWVIMPCPAIVSAETWDACYQIYEESLTKYKRLGPRAKHLLAGYITCADCDTSMYIYHQTKIPSYRCKGCGFKVGVSTIDGIYHGELETFLLRGKTQSEYVETTEAELREKEELLNLILEERGNLKKKMERIIEMRIANEMTKQDFSDHYNPLKERKTQIDDQVPELEAKIAILKVHSQSADVILQYAKNLYEEWDTLLFERKRYIVEMITEKVSIGKEYIEITLVHFPNQTPPATPSLNDGKGQADL